MHTTALPVKKKKGVNKLVLGFAALIASAVIGTTGIAAAHSNNNNNNHLPAAGYGANVNINNDINVGVSGNNNVITIIIRPIINIFR